MRKLVVKTGLCVGCMTCRNACAYYRAGEFNPSAGRLSIAMDPFTGEVDAEVLPSCDLCGGKPECIRWCPVGALRFTSRTEDDNA